MDFIYKQIYFKKKGIKVKKKYNSLRQLTLDTIQRSLNCMEVPIPVDSFFFELKYNLDFCKKNLNRLVS